LQILRLRTTRGDKKTWSYSTGKERDQESGNDYFGARYYASSMGRFLSPDDVGGHLEDPQTLNLYSYVANNPLSRTDPTGHDFWQSCDKASSTCGNQQIGTDSNGNAINHLVSGTTDDNGKFTATVVTSASLGQAGSGNTAAVNGSGVMITTGTGTSNSGEANYNGSGGYQGMVNTIKSMTADGHGPFHYPEEAFGNPFHPGATNYRFSTGGHPDLFNYGPSPHFPVPTSGTSVPDFHIDSGTGPSHLTCATMGMGCY